MNEVIITLDKNNDQVQVHLITNRGKEEVVTWECHRFEETEKIIISILNVVDPEASVILEEINEDRRRTIDSW